MEKLEIAIANLGQSITPSEVEEFRTGLFVGNHQAISDYLHNNDSSLFESIVDGLSFGFLTAGLKTAFKNDL